MSNYINLIVEVAQANHETIESDLREAEQKLEKLRAKVKKAEEKVNTLRSILNISDESHDTIHVEGSPLKLTLHDAMEVVLLQSDEGKMRAPEIATEINTRKLYVMRDGRPVEPQQIHARVGHYGDKFEKDGVFITVKKADGTEETFDASDTPEGQPHVISFNMTKVEDSGEKK